MSGTCITWSRRTPAPRYSSSACLCPLRMYITSAKPCDNKQYAVYPPHALFYVQQIPVAHIGAGHIRLFKRDTRGHRHQRGHSDDIVLYRWRRYGDRLHIAEYQRSFCSRRPAVYLPLPARVYPRPLYTARRVDGGLRLYPRMDYRRLSRRGERRHAPAPPARVVAVFAPAKDRHDAQLARARHPAQRLLAVGGGAGDTVVYRLFDVLAGRGQHFAHDDALHARRRRGFAPYSQASF